jgi:predicted Zn-dependent peptidase
MRDWLLNASTKFQLHALMRRAFALQDYLFQYKSGIEQVTTSDVWSAAKQHLHPATQVAVIAADTKGLESTLQAHGYSVKSLDVLPVVVDTAL